MYNFRNIVHFLTRILQVVDNSVFWQNVLLYFENELYKSVAKEISKPPFFGS